jgi:uncharacterized BrkB/YihY/UPF0761 family membrane protein
MPDIDPSAAPSLADVTEQPPTRSQQLRDRAADEFAAAADRIPVLGAIVRAARAEHDAGGGLLAGGVAYRIFFWLLPMGLAASSVAAMLDVTPERDLGEAAGERGLGSLIVSVQRQAIDASSDIGWYQLVASLVLAVWFGHGVVRALAVVFALAWQEPIRRVRRPLVAGLAFTVVATVLMLVASWINRAVGGMGLGLFAILLTRVFVFAGVAFGIAVAFPHGTAPRRALLPGCFVGAIGAVGLYVAVNVYLAPKVESSVDTYGMLGVATVILLWLYLLARLISISAFLNAALWRATAVSEARDDTPSAGSA